MSSVFNFIFGAILIIIWIIAGVFITQANIFLSSYKNIDEYFHRAYWLTFWGAFVTWFLIGVFIILIILSVIGVVALFGSGVGEVGVAGEEGIAAESEESSELESTMNQQSNQNVAKQGISIVTIGFLTLALILVSVTGILAAISADSLKKSDKFKLSIEKLKTAYNDCIISACICIGAAGILIIGIITYLIIGLEKKSKINKQEKQIQQKRQFELEQYRELQTNELKKKAQERELFIQQLQNAKEQALIASVSQK